MILDAKRGDIGSTAEQYAREAFERYQADSVTVNPYMGFDLDPAVSGATRRQGRDRAVPHVEDPGDLPICILKTGGRPLYQVVAQLAADKWNASGQLALVVGATFPKEIEVVRRIVGDMPLLIPGIGAQGGDVEATVHAGRTANGTGMLINSSRAIIYAGKGDEFAEAAAQAHQRHARSDQRIPLMQTAGCDLDVVLNPPAPFVRSGPHAADSAPSTSRYPPVPGR